ETTRVTPPAERPEATVARPALQTAGTRETRSPGPVTAARLPATSATRRMHSQPVAMATARSRVATAVAQPPRATPLTTSWAEWPATAATAATPAPTGGTLGAGLRR